MNASFILREDPREIVRHWCFGLPPGIGIVDSLARMLIGLMQPPKFVLHRERIELFPSCSALALPRRVLKEETQRLLLEIEREEFRARAEDPPAHRFFARHRTAVGGDFEFSDFVGDTELARGLDAGTWIEALLRALWEGAEHLKFQVSEICRAAILNALGSEPPPEPPPDLIALQERYDRLFEADAIRDDESVGGGGGGAASPSRPIARRDRVSAPFLKPMPKPAAQSAPSEWNPYNRSEALRDELKRARALEAPYARARDLRLFMRHLHARVALWT
jgi:hypothetical protein